MKRKNQKLLSDRKKERHHSVKTWKTTGKNERKWKENLVFRDPVVVNYIYCVSKSLNWFSAERMIRVVQYVDRYQLPQMIKHLQVFVWIELSAVTVETSKHSAVGANQLTLCANIRTPTFLWIERSTGKLSLRDSNQWGMNLLTSYCNILYKPRAHAS